MAVRADWYKVGMLFFVREKALLNDPLRFIGPLCRGGRKVTTGITGLWQPSVHSDVAF